MARKPSEPSPKSTGSKRVGDDRPPWRQAPATGRAQIAGRGQAASEPQVAGETQVAGEPTGPIEAAGPVTITRLRKGDGRGLILYSAVGGRA
jgi:hypothetical protein